jgi:hypothetical protein
VIYLILPSHDAKLEDERIMGKKSTLKQTHGSLLLQGSTYAVTLWLVVTLTVLAVFAISGQSAWAQDKFRLETTAFKPGGDIPARYTCDSADVSPALTWNEPPQGTQSFALIVDDPDAPSGTFTHWLVYDLPKNMRKLPEALSGNDEMHGGGRQGTNDFPVTGYGGPCPPPGRPHRYFFKLYALDAKLNVRPAATRRELEQAMKGHILAQAELMGKYHR